jgi:hypothetical protein
MLSLYLGFFYLLHILWSLDSFLWNLGFCRSDMVRISKKLMSKCVFKPKSARKIEQNREVRMLSFVRLLCIQMFCLYS